MLQMVFIALMVLWYLPRIRNAAGVYNPRIMKKRFDH